ncbi:MAG: SDR family NAD(P)-dependent oxidoreductase [Geminicoccaceae bacterium]
MIINTALITGASRGYGLELCRALSARGAHVFGTVRTVEGAAALTEACGGAVTPIQADVTEESAGAAITAALAARDMPLDLLVNNAGVMTTGARIEEVSIADIDRLLRVHVHGPIICTQAALAWLRRAPQGAVVNVTSRLGSIARIAAGTYDHLRISYAMRVSKAAQNMLSVCLHRELATEGIAVYAVHPGRLQTRMGSTDADVDAAEAAARLLGWLGRNREERLIAYVEPDRDELPW